MKRILGWKSLVLAAGLVVNGAAVAQSTAFTYQGQLNDGGTSANGSYDISFAAYDASINGNLASVIVTNVAVAVSNGVFTTTVDFGNGVFTGSDLWLEIAVSTNAADAFSTIAPRQLFTPVPYALYATVSGTANTVASSTVAAPQLNTAGNPASGQVLGYNGAQLVWQDPVVGGSSGGWALTGNLGTSSGINFLGTSDNQPMIIKAGGVRALRLEPDATGSGAPNVIGGSPANYVSNNVVGATIGGGGAVNYFGATYSNTVAASFATIGGGVRNIAGGAESLVGGGYQNLAAGYISTIAGGAYNRAYGSEATVAGGAYNVATNDQAFVGGGYNNTASGSQSFVGSGYQNVSRGYISAIAGGAYNQASGSEASVGGGAYNLATNDQTTVAGGYQNTAFGLQATIGGGYQNAASGDTSFIGGGLGNIASGNDQVSDVEFFLGNPFFFFFSGSSTVSGGHANTASASCAIVPGGAFNTAAGDCSLAAGFHANALHAGSFVWADDSSSTAFSSTANNQFLLRAIGGVGIGTAQTPPGGLRVASGGLAVTGGSSPNYPGAAGVFIEKAAGVGAVFAYDYTNHGPLSLALNSPGGNVGVGILSPQAKFHVFDSASVSDRIETSGGVNAWSRMEFANANGQWNVGTSRGYNGDQLYFNRNGVSGNALALQPSGDATFSANVSVCSLTVRGGCDVAEPFATTGPEMEKGSVVVIDPAHPGQLKLSNQPYDTRVAGVVSGANGINPGIALHQEGVLEGGQNVALSGRVYVLADTTSGPIQPGDMLTTSTQAGHAMKVSDHARAQGAIIGKAMTGLLEGKGMVLVLVSLQ